MLFGFCFEENQDLPDTTEDLKSIVLSGGLVASKAPEVSEMAGSGFRLSSVGKAQRAELWSAFNSRLNFENLLHLFWKRKGKRAPVPQGCATADHRL